MERISVDSNNLVSVGYDDNNCTLEVEFNNGIYRYFDVPSDVYGDLMGSGSKGSYFNRNIRNSYGFEKI
jgi:hypothetical protein